MKILSRKDREQTQNVAITEGCAHSVMVGFGEQYVVPFALKLGASSAQIGILSALPAFLGAWAQIITAGLSSKVKSRKRLAATFAFIQGVMFAPLFIVPLLTNSITILTIVFSAYTVFGSMAHPPWRSLLADVVMPKERTMYFAKRNKAMLLILVSSLVAAGIIMNYLEATSIWLAFWVLFSIAFFAKTTSVIFLLKYKEPENNATDSSKESFFDFVRKIRKTNFGKFVIFKSMLEFSVMLGGPFLAIYWLNDLHFSYIQYSMLTLTGLLVKAISSPYWGRYAKSFGTRNMMFVSAILVSSLPMTWFFAGYLFGATQYAFWAFMLTEALTGFSWGGLELTTFTNTFENSTHNNIARRVAYFTAILGTFVLLGGIAGAGIVYYLEHSDISRNVFKVMFLLSFAARLTTTVIFIGGVKEVVVMKKVDENKLLIDFVLVNPLKSSMHGTRYMFDSFIERNDGFLNKRYGFHSKIEAVQGRTMRMLSNSKRRKVVRKKGKPFKRKKGMRQKRKKR